MSAEPFDKTIRRFASNEEQELETLRYWQSRTPEERFLGVWEATVAAYVAKGIHLDPAHRSSRTIRRVKRESKEQE